MKNNEINTNMKRLEIENFNPRQEFNKKWITEGIDSDTINFSERMGFYLCQYHYNPSKSKYESGNNSLSSSQIRNFFGEIKRIQMKLKGRSDTSEAWKDIKTDFLLLRPKLAYAAGRALQKNKKSVLPVLSDVLTNGIIAVDSDNDGAYERFNNLVDFLESILAYHKSFGGNSN